MTLALFLTGCEIPKTYKNMMLLLWYYDAIPVQRLSFITDTQNIAMLWWSKWPWAMQGLEQEVKGQVFEVYVTGEIGH